MIEFLSIKTLDKDESDFAKAFRRLIPKSQNIFFKTMAEKGKLREAVELVPTDITDIAINFKNTNPIVIGNIVGKLEKFTDLKRIHFDISEISPYTTYELKLCNIGIVIATPGGKFSWYKTPNETAQDLLPSYDRKDVAQEVIYDSATLLANTKKIEIITIHFRGHREEIRKENNKLSHSPNHSTPDPLTN